VRYAAIFTLRFSLVFSLATLAMVRLEPPMPKLTVNWPELTRAVERTAVTWQVQGLAPAGRPDHRSV
jgi:hypothetical protein